jgi:hypothetical protein
LDLPTGNSCPLAHVAGTVFFTDAFPILIGGQDLSLVRGDQTRLAGAVFFAVAFPILVVRNGQI